jgi:hypothetical protein
MTHLLNPLVTSIAEPSNHRRDGEYNVELDDENEPIVEVPKPYEGRAASHDDIRNKLVKGSTHSFGYFW